MFSVLTLLRDFVLTSDFPRMSFEVLSIPASNLSLYTSLFSNDRSSSVSCVRFDLFFEVQILLTLFGSNQFFFS